MKHILIAALLCSALMATDKKPVPACSDAPKGTYPCTYKSDCNTCTLWNKYGGECTAMTCGELLPFVGSTQTVLSDIVISKDQYTCKELPDRWECTRKEGK